MADQIVRVVLEAAIAQYQQEMAKAKQSAEQVSGAVEGIGTTAGKSGKQTVDAANQAVAANEKQKRSISELVGQHQEAFKAAERTGKFLTTRVTLPILGLGAAITRTGISYNALEQRSRSALTTILGSAEAATRQMDTLVAFGRQSPFPRQTWIEAQQQLLGFGMAAEKIVPVLGAVQDAVAATGGTSQDIAGIVDVLARIQGQGRITGQELNRLGIRGIDAVTMLAQAAGVTGDEIRDRISAGAVDADFAIAALVAGINERMGGAAQGMRDTWDGAVDRVKGAFRDLSSAIMEPFVGTQGGGAAVDAANAFADSLRTLEAAYRNLTPAQQSAVLSTVGLVAAVGPALWGIGRLGRGVQGAVTNFQALRAGVGGLTAAKMSLVGLLGGPWGIAIGLATAAIGLYARSKMQAAQRVRELTDAIAADSGAIAENTRQHVANRLEQEGVLAAAQRLGFNLATVTEAALGNTDAIRELETAAAGLADQYDETLPVGAKATKELHDQQRAARGVIGAVGGLSGELEDAVATYGRVEEATGGAADATRNLGAGVLDLNGLFEDATAVLADYVDEVRRSTDPVYRLETALTRVEEKQQDYNDAVKEYGERSPEASSAAWDMYEAFLALEIAANDGDLAFEEFEARLEHWVEQGVVTEEQAKGIRERVDELRVAIGKLPSKHTVTVDFATRRYGELIEKFDQLDGRLLTRGFRGEDAHTGGVITPSGAIRRYHAGGLVGPSWPGRSGLAPDEVPVVLQTRERVLSRKQNAAFEQLMRTVGTATVAAGPANVTAALASRTLPAARSMAPVLPSAGSGQQQGGPGGLHVDQLTVKAVGPDFSIRRVMDDLALHGAV